MYMSLSVGRNGAWFQEKCANSLCGILSLFWGSLLNRAPMCCMGWYGCFPRVYEPSGLSETLGE